MMQKSSNVRHRAFRFSIEIVAFCKSLPNTRIYWTIVDQLFRSATSVGANLIEAQAASSRKDFIKFYQIALKSANETLYWLYILRDGGLEEVDLQQLADLITEVKEISAMIGKSLITLKDTG